MYIKIIDNSVIDINQEKLDSLYVYIADDIPVSIGNNVKFNKDGTISYFYTGNKIDDVQAEHDELVLKAQQQRKELLDNSDWIVIKAMDTNTAVPTEWQVYRQALRDITTHANYPNLLETDWPTEPTI